MSDIRHQHFICATMFKLFKIIAGNQADNQSTYLFFVKSAIVGAIE